MLPWAALGLGALVLIGACAGDSTVPEDHCSFLQQRADVHHGSNGSKDNSSLHGNVSQVPLLGVASLDTNFLQPGLGGSGGQSILSSISSSTDMWNCKEGDTTLAFHNGRDCSDFTEAELDQPMDTWPYLTRWCKLAKRNVYLQGDQCMAQQCIAGRNPKKASKIWWETKVRDSFTWQNDEFNFCVASGFCDGRHPLRIGSTLEDAEKYCDTVYKDDWKKTTPRETLMFVETLSGDIQKLTCAWGTLHCDAHRCQSYFCGAEAQEIAVVRHHQEALNLVADYGMHPGAQAHANV